MGPAWFSTRRGRLFTLLGVFAALLPRIATAQPGQNDPPATYEVQIDGESFQIESGQRPVKVQSKLKPGTTYDLGVRVALSQILRLNSVRMEYGMWAKIYDDKGKDIRVVQIVNDLGFTLRITDIGHRLEAKPADKLLDTLVAEAEKRYTDRKATGLKHKGPVEQRFGDSVGKGTKITYQDDTGVGHSAMIFVLSGEKYTIAAEAEYRDQDFEDMMPWLRAALTSIRPLHK
jgi:hypothetical protein